MIFVVDIHIRWRNVIAAPPDMNLVVAIFRRGFTLIEALQGTVVAFVQPPVANDRNPHQVHLVLDVPERTNRTLQNGCVSDVEVVAEVPEELSGRDRFRVAFLREIDIVPTRKQVLEIPVTLAVTAENELASHVCSSLLFVSSRSGLSVPAPRPRA